MVASNIKIIVIASLLIAIGASLTIYKNIKLGFPLLPGQYREVWTIESKITFDPSAGPVSVELTLPEVPGGWTILDEHFASSGFGFSVTEVEQERTARWTRQSLEQRTTLYYKLQTYRSQVSELDNYPDRSVQDLLLEPDQEAAITRLVDIIREKSVDASSFTEQLIYEFNRESLDQDVEFLLGTYDESIFNIMLDVLSYAGIPAHSIRGIMLEDGRRRQTLSYLLEIYDGESWIVFHPDNGEIGIPENFLIWQRGPAPVLNIAGAQNSRLEFALVSNNLPAQTVVRMEEISDQYALMDFSIYALPVEQQGIFKGLLLLPVATLVVVLMRLIVGIKTSGTFMPVLIALAFIQTTLWVGLAIFFIIVSIGLLVRSWLSHLNLLLVARVASVIVMVILIMAMLALASYKLGLDQALTVTFFPTIILAWTIERMSILWEEEGGHEVLIIGSGSMLVAILAYLVMSIRVVEHLTFNFPELLLCLLGVTLLLGKYTGYRLTELYRFRDLDHTT